MRMTEHYLWESLAILLPIVAGGIITILIHTLNQRRDKNARISNMKEAIKQEIKENMDSIKDFKVITKTERETQESELKYLTIASFDSSVNSGDFILLSTELRQEISQLYTYIHVANFQSDQLIKSQYILADDKARFEQLIQRQFGILAKSYQDIVKQSKNLLKKL